MARILKIGLVYVSVLVAVGLPIYLDVWLLPSWRDLPQPANFSLFMLFEDTDYAPSFSELKFSRLRLGMRKAEVVRALGEPLSIVRRSRRRVTETREWEDGLWTISYKADTLNALEPLYSETYYYSRAGDSSDHWYVRAITFSSDGHVISIRKVFYED
ncbi:MAG TPA: hypothetical protein VKM72_14955 [Thermoanaerobaculia bacterium]|nr:hypothetical protein [Thermoanaerobaculia bacterium]